jgi:hypothetical protein
LEIEKMNLEQIIKFLEELNQDGVVPFGFGEPDSFRGYYEDVAFEPVKDAKISDMLKHAKSAMNATFTGYKGGEFTMSEYTDCWISIYGSSCDADKIGSTLLNTWKHLTA